MKVSKKVYSVFLFVALFTILMGCPTTKPQWVNVNLLPESYNGNYKLTGIQVRSYVNDAWTWVDMAGCYNDKSSSLSGITVQKTWSDIKWRTQVIIAGLSYDIYFDRYKNVLYSTFDIRSLGEVLGNNNNELQECSANCTGDQYRILGEYWGGGFGVKDYNVDYYFSAYTMTMVFLDNGDDRSRDIKLSFKKI